MSEELRPCPYCLEQPIEKVSKIDGVTYYSCGNRYTCPAAGWFTADEWNNRPIEDALTARIAELEAENDRLQSGWFRDETICPDGSLRPKVSDLLNRIAELSQAVGLITTLKPTMVMDANHPLDMVREVAEHVTARIAKLEAAQKEALSLLPELERGHYYCDDCWYSCPKAVDGCCDESRGDECDCGADDYNALLAKIIGLLTPEVQK